MNTWRARWAARAGAPTLTLGAEVVTGPAFLTGAERWSAAFRGAGLGPGDRLVTVLPTGACLAQVLLAGLWEGLTLVPLAPTTDLAAAAAEADPAAAVVAPNARDGGDVGWAWRAEGPGGPADVLPERRPAGPPTPPARLLCARSDGGPWAALLDDNLEHAVDTVLMALQPAQARWLSVVPWHTPAGVLLDLLPALLQAQAVVRPAEDKFSAQDVANIVQRWQPSHGVLPLSLVGELRRLWGGLDPLRVMSGGLATGPGLDAQLAADLGRTTLRTQRGAPELSCMVTLGEPGMWRIGALGRPVGCTISDGPGGGLLVSGRPIAGGRWVDGTFQPVDRMSPVVVALA